MLRKINQVTLRSLVVKIPLKRQWRDSRGGINVKKDCQRLQVSFSFTSWCFFFWIASKIITFLAWGSMFVLFCFNLRKWKLAVFFHAFCHTTFHHASITCCSIPGLVHLNLVKATLSRINQLQRIVSKDCIFQPLISIKGNMRTIFCCHAGRCKLILVEFTRSKWFNLNRYFGLFSVRIKYLSLCFYRD